MGSSQWRGWPRQQGALKQFTSIKLVQAHWESSYVFSLGDHFLQNPGFSRSSVRFGHAYSTGSWGQDIASGRQVD